MKATPISTRKPPVAYWHEYTFRSGFFSRSDVPTKTEARAVVRKFFKENPELRKGLK
jgi:hypothetical protein